MDPFTIGAIATAIAGLFFVFWDWVRDAISTWMRKHLDKNSRVMDAWVQFTKAGDRVKSTIKVKTPRWFINKEVLVDTRELDLSQCPSEVQDQLKRSGAARQSAMQYVNG